MKRNSRLKAIDNIGYSPMLRDNKVKDTYGSIKSGRTNNKNSLQPSVHSSINSYEEEVGKIYQHPSGL